MLTLAAEKRETTQDNDGIRREGFVPSVFYGAKTDSTPVSVALGDFLRVWHEAGESAMISLKMGKDEKDVLIHEVQVHPLTGKPLHVDFYVVEEGQTVEVDIPLEFIGEAPAEDKGGVVVKVLHELPVEAEPKKLPQHIEVDLSGLEEIGDHITVGDISLPEGVVAQLDADDIIISVQEPREEEPEEESTEIDLESIELSEERGKAPEEGAEGEAGGAEAGTPGEVEEE